MPLAFVLDEQLRGPLWHAIGSHNMRGVHPIDAVRVGDSPDLPLGSLDPDILVWAEAHDRILVTKDEKTLKSYLAKHLQTGRHSPGVFIIRRGSTLAGVTFFLAVAAHASESADWRDQVVYIP